MRKPRKYKTLQNLKNLELRRWRRKLRSKRSHGRPSFAASTPKISTGPQPVKYSRTVPAPAHFCIKENPEMVIEFINKLNEYLTKRKSCYIDLSAVTQLSPDAVVVLLSILGQFKRFGVPFNGNFPNNPDVKRQLIGLGFLETLYDAPGIIRYDTSTRDVIRKHGKVPHGKMAKELILQCTKNIWREPKRCQGVYRILMELMQNTHSHAIIGKEGVENWWISKNYDEYSNTECFSFVDYGVGVFNSLEKKQPGTKFFGSLDRIRRSITEPSNHKVLQLILEGELHRTSTGHSYRGKGLPGIKTAMERNQISNLYIITNDVYANVAKKKFVPLHNSFSGTFIYWELNDNNVCCKY